MDAIVTSLIVLLIVIGVWQVWSDDELRGWGSSHPGIVDVLVGGLTVGGVLIVLFLFGRSSKQSLERADLKQEQAIERRSVASEGPPRGSEVHLAQIRQENEIAAKRLRVSAVQLYQEYEENEVAADKKYQRKEFEVFGAVDSVQKSDVGGISVVLQSQKNAIAGLGLVRCILVDDARHRSKNEAKAAELRRGQQVALRGKGFGKSSLYVLILDCVFIDTEARAKLTETYQDPFVLHIRTALNNYLGGSTAGIEEKAIKAEQIEGIQGGLTSFDPAYYRSKFIVLTVDDFVLGGKEIFLVFVDKPDKVFNAWVFQYARDEDSYVLRTFSERVQSPEVMQQVQEAIMMTQESDWPTL
jgi:hypothetical protein